jgi:hypothetical protein
LTDAPWRQVRIEQRLIIRITPGMGRDLPPPPMMPPPRCRCARHTGGAGPPAWRWAGLPRSSPRADNQIMLLRDRRQIVADLEKTCSARDFYVGFYVERSADGMLCTRRPIHSRAGASCTITRLQQVGR